jgi:hypothetical protein
MLRPSAILRFTLPALAALGAIALHAAPASADRGTIKFPGQHPNYSFDAEPHLVAGFWDIGPSDDGLGLGFRGTIPIVDNGFVSTINNSVGIGFGLDWLHYEDDGCYRRRGDVICPDNDYEFDVLVLPVVMQWNFWLSERWSVFGEPGLVIEMYDNDYFDDDVDIDPSLYIGGRFLFNDDVGLVMRLGSPTFSIGVSFML